MKNAFHLVVAGVLLSATYLHIPTFASDGREHAGAPGVGTLSNTDAGGPAFSSSLEDVLEAIEAHETVISVVEADFKVTLKDGSPCWEGTWGRERNKGYRRGWQYIQREDGSGYRYEEIYAFDGERLRTFQPEPARMAGSVRELRGELDSYPSPHTLLGHGLRARYHLTLSDVLTKCHETGNLELTSAAENIDGHNCYLLTAIVPIPSSRDPTVVAYSAMIKIWIDAERDYRPVRIEKYRDALGKSLHGVCEFRLENVDGLWLPASGVIKGYTKNLVLLHGYTADEIKAMPENEARKHFRFETRLAEENFATKQIEVTNWRVLEDIDDAKFTIEFPPGSKVWDDFAQQGFTVGKE